MCGIAGFFHFDRRETSKDLLQEMVSCIAHRGPDDHGCIVCDKNAHHLDGNSGQVGLGHRRLSIIDLSERGRQPMAKANGKVWIVFNGEIYNYIELRKELMQSGVKFHTETDTEVVLASYLKWGTRCFNRFNGMWSLALFDGRSGELILSRDRFGKKPLYYFSDNNVLVFGSEIKLLLRHPSVPKQINKSKIIDYAGRHYRYVDDDTDSFFSGIYHVPKSSYVRISPNGSKTSELYWQLPVATPPWGATDENEVCDEFKSLLTNAVNIRLRSDVPVGTMLSGGLDSGSITCIASQIYPNLHTFSGVTGDGYYDESEYINEIVKTEQTQHTYLYPNVSDIFGNLSEMLKFHDEPVCTVTWLCNFIITKEIAKKNIPVMITGHGGDELLGGYWDHYHYHFADLRNQGIDDTPEMEFWLKNHGRGSDEYPFEKAYIGKLVKNNSVELEKYSQYMDCLSTGLLHHAKDKISPESHNNLLNRRLYQELFHETIPPSLRAEDRNMMAFSLENRVPFLDYRLVEFCFNLDPSYKIRNGLGKWLLREAMKGVLPEKVRMRKDKTGFNAPLDVWLRNELKTAVIEMMHTKTFINEEIYDIQKVRKLFEEHLDGKNHYMFFWQYINLNIWYTMLF